MELCPQSRNLQKAQGICKDALVFQKALIIIKDNLLNIITKDNHINTMIVHNWLRQAGFKMMTRHYLTTQLLKELIIKALTLKIKQEA